MIDWMLKDCVRNCQFLSEAVTDMTRKQWRVFDAQARFGICMWNALRGATPQGGPPREKQAQAAAPARAGSLEQVAAARLQSGLAPPREIYDIRNRGRIDWSRVPDWAKPVDPEQFEGGHEG